MNELFDIEKFNLISDEENYYFFRALEPGDIDDIKNGIIKEENEYKRLRTDSKRWEEKHQEKARWNEESKISLEEIYNHIKVHYSLQTNCISLTSNANIVRTYGETFSDKYVIIKVPKKDMGEKVFHAGQYMLDEIQKQIEKKIEEGKISNSILNELERIDKSKTSNEIQEIIKKRYKTKEKIENKTAKMKKGIKYKSPHARISSWQSLDEEQTLEKNKIVAKLTVLEQKKIIEPLMKYSSNNNILIQTVGSAFASGEQIYYGDIEGKQIIEASKEIIDIFSLLQQVEGQDKKIVEELKRKVIQFVIEGRKIEIPEKSIIKDEIKAKEDISIEEMYELTDGKVEYGKASDIVKNIFYLAKGQAMARILSNELRKITNNDSRYEKIIKYIEKNGYEIEPKISTRVSNRGYKLSESVNLNLKPNEIEMVNQIRKLSDKEQEEIIHNRGISNINEIMTSNFSKVKNEEKISKERYYAEAIFSMYDWQKIGIEEFSVEEKENLIKKMEEKDCIRIYQKLEEKGIEKSDIPRILLNTIMGKKGELNEELSIERVERFLGYYDVANTGIKLRPYQQKATDNTDKIFENNKFASVILPTGGGKSFVVLDQLMKHKDEKILYLAPQNEILEQMKDYIVKYIHGPANTLGKTKDQIVAEVFKNIKFATYQSLLKKDEEELKEQYDFIVLDELHRTGASEWGEKLNILLKNQKPTTKVLGITATPRRDVDGKDMSNEIAQLLGYTQKEAVNGKHIAMNMSLINAIRLGLVVNPKLISCAYTLKTDGSSDRLKEKIEQIKDINEKNKKLEQYDELRKKLDIAEGIPEILQANVKKGGKYIVFLPMIEEVEDEDGNKIGRKKGTAKIKEYERKIEEYFKGSDIKPNFHSMLGEYGDKSNEKRLEKFQNSNTDNVEFMLVINKANEGLHIKGLDGMIWLRPLDEKSKTLYLQQLGRVIYSEDPDNPTKDEKRPVVIDLVNNTLKVKWNEEITGQDNIEIMKIIIDWVEKHDEMLPDINSSDKDEVEYAKVLKEIQNKYKKYLKGDNENLNEKQIGEIKLILSLGNEIDLWQSELPNKINKKDEKGKNQKKLENNYKKFFDIEGIERDFVELEDIVEKECIHGSIQEEILKFLEKVGRLPIGKKKGEGTLYARWRVSEEKRTLEKYVGRDIEEVPKGYYEFIKQMRKYGYGLKKKTLQEEVLEFLEKERRLPNANKKEEKVFYQKWRISEEKRKLEEYAEREVEEVPEEYQEFVRQMREYGYGLKKKTLKEGVLEILEKDGRLPNANKKEEKTLYQKWRISEEKRILEEYVGKEIEEIPEEYREFVRQMRKYGYGLKKKTLQEEVLEIVEKEGRLPSGTRTRKRKREGALYQKWRISKEKRILEEYAGKEVEEVPEEYREFIKQMRKYGYGLKKKTLQEEVLETVEKEGRLPSETRKRERALYKSWLKSEEKRMLEKYAGREVEEVPEEYREFIKQMRKYGYGLMKKILKEEIIEFVNKEGRLPSGKIKGEEKLYRKWRLSEEKRILEEYVGKEIEEIPEEYQEFVRKMREYGYGLIKKILKEEIIEFVNKEGRLPSGTKKREITLYQKWRISEEKRILEEYTGREVKEVPEEYQEFVRQMREYGIINVYKGRKPKEIVQASIGSIKNIELIDKENKVLHDLIEKNKNKLKEE